MVVSTRRRTRSQGSTGSTVEEQPAAPSSSKELKTIEESKMEPEAEKQELEKVEAKDENEKESDKGDDPDQVENTDDHMPKSGDNPQSTLLTPRELRKQKRENLRSKSLGLVHIAKDGESAASKPNRKIVFDDEDNDAVEERESEMEESKAGEQADDNHGVEDGDIVASSGRDNDDNEDDDDEVEQVDTSAARDFVLQELARERAITQQQVSNKTKKRKSHYEQQHQKKQAELENLDDDFFAQLDAHKQEAKQNKKQRKYPQPKHTVFSSADDHVVEGPIAVNPSMELVVLGTGNDDNDDNHVENVELESLRRIMATMDTTKPSKMVLVNSRSIVADEPIATQKQLQKQKKHGLKVPGANWKRSKKMNRLLLGGGSGNRRQRGLAAANFVTAKQPQKLFKF